MADRRYYTEGSSARQLNYDDRAGRNRSREAVVRGSAAPARRPQPSVRPERCSYYFTAAPVPVSPL